jgi:hypothetical protein
LFRLNPIPNVTLLHYYFLGRSVGGGGVVERKKKKKEVGTKIAFISLLS